MMLIIVINQKIRYRRYCAVCRGAGRYRKMRMAFISASPSLQRCIGSESCRRQPVSIVSITARPLTLMPIIFPIVAISSRLRQTKLDPQAHLGSTTTGALKIVMSVGGSGVAATAAGATGGISSVAACVSALAVTVVMQSIFWWLSTRVVKSDEYTDFGGISNFLLLALVSFIAGDMYESVHKSLVVLYVIIWGSRLITFLYIRMQRWGRHDRRLEKIRRCPNGEAAFWIGQMMWVFVTLLPVVLLVSSSSGTAAAPVAFSLVDVVIGGIFLIGALIQAVADQVKLECYDGTRWLQVAIWKYSRHPNYFGEIVMWSSIFAASARVLPSRLILPAALSPIFVALLLLFVSGVPILERNADRKFGENKEYQEYKRSTSVLIPLPKKVYSLIPRSVQKTVLLDFDMYSHFDEKQEVLGGKKQAADEKDSESVDDGYTGQ